MASRSLDDRPELPASFAAKSVCFLLPGKHSKGPSCPNNLQSVPVQPLGYYIIAPCRQGRSVLMWPGSYYYMSYDETVRLAIAEHLEIGVR